jgi:hypothetical protein
MEMRLNAMPAVAADKSGEFGFDATVGVALIVRR